MMWQFWIIQDGGDMHLVYYKIESILNFIIGEILYARSCGRQSGETIWHSYVVTKESLVAHKCIQNKLNHILNALP